MIDEILSNVEDCLNNNLSDSQKLLAEYLIRKGYDSKAVALELKSMEYAY